MKMSLVIPAFNEEPRIGNTIRAVAGFFSGRPWESELIVVDDGSTDRTIETVEREWKEFRGRKIVLKNETNRGKGYSVRRGMLEASGEYVFFSDADLSTPIEEIEKLLRALVGGADVALGSRDLPDSDVQVHQNILREFMGKVYNRLAQALTFKNIQDSQCGFKGFTRDAARILFGLQKIEGFSFDAEIVWLAQKRGYQVREIPVVWRNSPKSRVSVLRDPLLMFWDLLRIRWIHRGNA